VYATGIYLGSGLSFLLGGIAVRYAATQEIWTLPLVGAMHSWQLIFFIVGLPGLLLVPLLLTVQEPRAGRAREGAAARSDAARVHIHREAPAGILAAQHRIRIVSACLLFVCCVDPGILPAAFSLGLRDDRHRLRLDRCGVWLPGDCRRGVDR
jgi:MFS family permease